MKKIVLALIISGVGVVAYFLFLSGSSEISALLRIDVNEGDKYNMFLSSSQFSDGTVDEVQSYLEMVSSYEVKEKRDNEIDFEVSISFFKLNEISDGFEYSYNSEEGVVDSPDSDISNFSELMHSMFSPILNTPISLVTVNNRGEIVNKLDYLNEMDLANQLLPDPLFVVFPENKLNIGDSFSHNSSLGEVTYLLNDITSEEYLFEANGGVYNTSGSGTVGFFKSSCMSSSVSIESTDEKGRTIKVDFKTEIEKK